MALERINPASIAAPTGYTHVIKAGSTVYIAGQVGRKPNGTVAGPDIAAQTEQVYKNLQEALKAAGCGFEDVTKVTVYMTHREDLPEARAVREKYMGTHPPTSTLVLISGLASPEYRIEVEAIAVVP